MQNIPAGTYLHRDTVVLWCAVSAVLAVCAVEAIRLAPARGKRARDWFLIGVCLAVAAGIGIGLLQVERPEPIRVDGDRAPAVTEDGDAAARR